MSIINFRQKFLVIMLTAESCMVVCCTDSSEISSPNAPKGQTGSVKSQDPSLEKKEQSGATAESNDITSDTTSDTTTTSKPKNSPFDPGDFTSKPLTPEQAKTADDQSNQAIQTGMAVGDVQGSELKYPSLLYKGDGTYSCKGELSGAHAKVSSTLGLPQLQTNLDDAVAENRSSLAQTKINDQLKASLDSVIYKRLSTDERNQWKQKGYDLPDQLAIFAMSAQKVKAGELFNFDKPLPVAFWPATATRYDELATKGPRSWTANVSGTKSFTAIITLSYVKTVGDLVTLKLSTNIPEDNGDRSYYELFPLARESVITVDTKAINTVKLVNTNWFNAHNCSDRPEETVMTYNLCQKTVGSNVQSFPCP